MSKRLITIRTAQPVDAVKIMQAIRPMMDEAAIEFPPVIEAEAIHWIVNTIANGHVLVAEMTGRMIGSLGLAVRTYPWNSRAPFLYNAWFYVHPKFRAGGTAKHLIDKAKAFAAAHDNAAILIDITTAVEAERKDRFMKAMGFTYCGGLFAFGLDKQAPAADPAAPAQEAAHV